MHHIVAGLDIRQAGKPLSARAFCLLRRRGCTLARSEQGKAGKRIFRARRHAACRHGHMPRRAGLRKFCIKGGREACARKVPREGLARAPGAGQHAHGIFLGQQGFQLFRQRAHFARPWRQCMRGHVHRGGKAHVRHSAGKIFAQHGAVFPGRLPQRGAILVKFIQPGAQHALFQQAFHLFAKAERQGARRLADGAGF